MTYRSFFKTATGNDPFPFQERLAVEDLTHLALTAPTGAGKTAAVVLAWLWQRRQAPVDTPRRLVLTLPQRTLVEQSFLSIKQWLENLTAAGELGDEPRVYPMLGGYVDEAWELKPESTAILVGTQDQLLSRALNRGYSMSRFRWPIHFGLLHSDVQWVFDEVQLMGVGLTTSAQLAGLRSKLGSHGPVGSMWMSATTNPAWLETVDHPNAPRRLSLDDKDREELAERLHAVKPLYGPMAKLEGDGKVKMASYLKDLARQIEEIHVEGSLTLVVINTVARARELFGRLNIKNKLLLHSRFRPQERANQVTTLKDFSGVAVTTQVVEAGVDISARRLVTELCPWPSLIQRFGRCNRRGEFTDAEVHWLDLDDKVAAPYEVDELNRAREGLRLLESVEPARFPETVDDPLPITDTLRRRDLMDLFDTTSDISGMDIDVGRFVRDADERDVSVFWREWDGPAPPRDLPAPHRNELCPAPLAEVRRARAGTVFWYFDHLSSGDKEGMWRESRQDDLIPGRVFLLPSSGGHYDPALGWLPDETKRDVPIATDRGSGPFPTITEDRNSWESGYLTLQQHTDNVMGELERILQGLGLEPELNALLRRAALWHDVGKAHHVFQETMGNPGTEVWAKRPGQARHSRRFFRHELASAMVAWQQGLGALELFLIAAHHGKARVTIRRLPGETDQSAILGLIEGDTILPVTLTGLELPEQILDLAPLRLGPDSWLERVLGLVEKHGPFRLAYLEALLRAADVNASKKEKQPQEETACQM